MHCLHLDSDLAPEACLATEDTLLEAAETGGHDVLCFWESCRPFVVVGFGQTIEREVDVAACRAEGVPILRRQSGGGAVVQGPGCLNYALVLRIELTSELGTIAGTNRWIMERHRTALTSLIGDRVVVRGHTDLAVRSEDGVERKVSGNAQRRRRNALLFHGTLLHHPDTDRMSRLLRFPSLSPDYRHHRSHAEFVGEIPVSADALREAWTREWDAQAPETSPDPSRVQASIEARYALDSWNLRR